MQEHDPMPLEKKLHMLNSGQLGLSVASKSFKDPLLLERGENYYIGDQIFDRTFIHWPNKMSTSAPGPTSTGYDFLNHRQFSGINFATQDYMSLCFNPGSMQAAVDALKSFGSHSGGSPLFFGNNPYYLGVLDSLKVAFGKLYPNPSTMIYSAGWMAGYGVVSALSTKNDVVIMDELCHNCLQHGAKASGAVIHKIEHLNNDDMCAKIEEVRKGNPNCGIIVVTESLFSMDSDCPDLDRLQKVSEANNAVLVVDTAHDMFSQGVNGFGNSGDKIKSWDNVVLLGSGSKALANNFGWVVSNRESLPYYMKAYSGPMTFSNALAPSVAANVKYNIDLLMGEEGEVRRKKLMDNSIYIRKQIVEAGFQVIGDPSPIVIIPIGSEFMSRSIANMLYFDGIIVNSVEFPACAPGDSRLRLQIQCDHTKAHLDSFVEKLVAVIPKVEAYLASDELAKVLAVKLTENVAKHSL